MIRVILQPNPNKSEVFNAKEIRSTLEKCREMLVKEEEEIDMIGRHQINIRTK
jgi:hypothetical protein